MHARPDDISALPPGPPDAKQFSSLLTHTRPWMEACDDRESLAAPGAFAGTTAVRCDVAAPAITGAKLLRTGLENVTITGRHF